MVSGPASVCVCALAAALAASLVAAHGPGLPINPSLGVPGFPDCTHPGPISADVDTNAHRLVCSQRPKDRADQIAVGCVGDSITAGAHSSGGNHTYPAQLQMLLGDGYKVTNLGACGSTMLKKGNSPYWQRPQYKALTAAKWDIIIVMLGTNDAKDLGDKGPNNWQHDCGGPNHTTLDGCSFASDYHDMIQVIQGLGTKPAGPTIYAAIPPPLMAPGADTMNQTVINSVFPNLVPLINQANSLPHPPIDVFSNMGGVPDWPSKFPDGCVLNSPFAPCAWWCDKQSCDQCHPNDDGYAVMAKVMKAGLVLSR